MSAPTQASPEALDGLKELLEHPQVAFDVKTILQREYPAGDELWLTGLEPWLRRSRRIGSSFGRRPGFMISGSSTHGLPESIATVANIISLTA